MVQLLCLPKKKINKICLKHAFCFYVYIWLKQNIITRSTFYLKGMPFVATCPSNLTEKLLASDRLGCENDLYGNNRYMCAPNEAKTSLVEICIDGIMGILEEGKLYNCVF